MSTTNDSMIAVAATGGEIDSLKHLTPEELEQARNLAQTLDVTDGFAIMALGAKSQKDLSALTDQVLKATATKNTGAAGQALTELMGEIKALDVDSFANAVEHGLSRIPIIGSMFGGLQKFISQYESISVKIDRTVVALESSRNTLSRDIVLLNNLYARNTAYFRDLLMAIGAGELKLQALRAEQAGRAEEATESGDPVLAQQVADLGDAISRLERRVHDLKLAAMVCLQSAPQMRLVQGSDQVLVEKIQSSILTTIPLWKQHVIIAISLFNQKKANELTEAVDRTTNELLIKNSNLVRDGVGQTEKTKERGFVEIETLRTVNDNLIATIDETIKIQEEGRLKRQEVEAELGELQAALRNKLTEIRPAPTR